MLAFCRLDDLLNKKLFLVHDFLLGWLNCFHRMDLLSLFRLFISFLVFFFDFLLFFFQTFFSFGLFFDLVLLSFLFWFLQRLLIFQVFLWQRDSQSFKIFLLVKEMAFSLGPEMCTVGTIQAFIFYEITEFGDDQFACLVVLLIDRCPVTGKFL